jgi:hypothetical protein
MSDVDDPSIKVTIRTGTSTRPAQPGGNNRPRGRVSARSQDRFVRYLLQRDGILVWPHRDMSAEIVQRSMRDGGLRRNRRVKLAIESHDCAETEVAGNCTVCLQKFKLEEKLATLSCAHTFHFACLQEWGKYKQECPLCRSAIPILER